MANGIYNALYHRIANANLAWSSGVEVVKAMLLRDTGSYVFDPDHANVDAILATGVEISVASYSRQSLANKTITQDDANDREKFDADNIAFGNLESGQTVSQVIFYEELTDDSDNVPLIHIDGKIDITAAAPVVVAPTGSITNATQTNPVTITSSGHGLANGDKVYISGVGGMTELNDRVFTITNTTSNTFDLQGEDGTGHTAYTSGGTWSKVMTLYIEPLLQPIADRTSVDFGGGATALVNGAVSKDARSLELINLAAGISEGDKSTDVQTTLNLPSALGGGAYNVNINVDGLFTFKQRK